MKTLEIPLLIACALLGGALIYISVIVRQAGDRCVELVGKWKDAEAEADRTKLDLRFAKSDIESLRRFIADQAQVPPPAPRAVPNRYATVLDADKFARIWRSVNDDTEVYLAVQQLLALETVAAIDDATSPTLTDRHGSLANAQGQVNALLSFADALDKARKTPEQWMPKEARG